MILPLRRGPLLRRLRCGMIPILNPTALRAGGRTNLDEIDLERRLSDPVCDLTAIDTRSANGLQL
jgi:hypothetical protein